jgi:hypothetical protein
VPALASITPLTPLDSVIEQLAAKPASSSSVLEADKSMAQSFDQHSPAKAKAPVHRGKGSRKRHRRGGRLLQEAEGDAEAARILRLRQRTLKHTDLHKSSDFSLVTHSSPSSTGWHGRRPSLNSRDAILQAYLSGDIKKLLASFYPVFYNE